MPEANFSAQPESVFRWLRVIVLFALAPALQIAMYAPQFHGPIWGHLPVLGAIADEVLYAILFLVFVLGPAAVAFVLSFRMLRLFVGPNGVTVLVLLALGSAYAGVFICFNVWGT